MVVDGKRFGVIFLAAVVSTVCFLLLTATPSIAQNNGRAGENQYNNENGDCPGAEEVESVSGTGDKQSPVFNITGESFRVTTTIRPGSIDPQLVVVTAFVRTEDDEPVADFSKEGSGTDSSIINDGPGRFFLDLSTANADFTVKVEDCTETGQNSGNQNNQGSSNQDRDNDVIRNTIPNKPLPPTGGWPVYALVASSILAGAGLLGFRLGIWRGRR